MDADRRKHMPVFKVLTCNRSNVMLSIIKTTFARHTTALKSDRKAAGALEYALLASFIALAVIGGATTFGAQLKETFKTMTAAATDVATAAAAYK
jgi:Flp pilus assembly pilin Flp